MGSAYTPGLLIAPGVRLRKVRMLPIEGDVLVARGDPVRHDTVVARAERRGRLHIVRAAQVLDVEPERVPGLVRVREGDRVEARQIVAQISHLFGWMRTSCVTPVTGTVESISARTGHLTVREDPDVIDLPAYIAGTVVEVHPGRGATVETRAAVVQGIFGLGGERSGRIRCIEAEHVDPGTLRPDDAGRVIVAAGRATSGGLERARELGVAGIVAGSVGYEDIRPLLGDDIGVAITGQEEIGFTLVVTEGFGDIAMAQRTRGLLREMNGRMASLNGTTQIRAGVIRPEVIVPRDDVAETAAVDGSAVSQQLRQGAPVRMIREPWFGRLGTVSGLPEQPVRIETGAAVRVVDVALDDGESVRVPRSNVEVIV